MSPGTPERWPGQRRWDHRTPAGVTLAGELNVLAYPGNTTTTLATPPPLHGVTVP